MILLKNVCVYCGSNPGKEPSYAEAAERLGELLADAGVGLVYGGGSVGLMGILARSVLTNGGMVTGVIPKFLKEREVMLTEVPNLVVTGDMHERKRVMFERADGFVALPGGIGTLEETVEMLTWSQLGQHIKPVVLANLGGFWDPLIELFRHMEGQGFLAQGHGVNYSVVDKVEAVLPTMEAALARVEDAATGSGLSPAGLA